MIMVSKVTGFTGSYDLNVYFVAERYIVHIHGCGHLNVEYFAIGGQCWSYIITTDRKRHI